MFLTPRACGINSLSVSARMTGFLTDAIAQEMLTGHAGTWLTVPAKVLEVSRVGGIVSLLARVKGVDIDHGEGLADGHRESG